MSNRWDFEPRFLNISFVDITEDTKQKVADRCKVPIQRVREYLANKDDQDKELLRAFLFYGVGPLHKHG
jgi:hypothetical protein